MALKTVGFENLYNRNFYIERANVSKRHWPENSVFDKFRSRARDSSAIMIPRGCNAVITAKNGVSTEVSKNEIVYVPMDIMYIIRIEECDSENSMLSVFNFKLKDCDGSDIICGNMPFKIPSEALGSCIFHMDKIFEITHRPYNFYARSNALAYSLIADVISAFKNDSHKDARFKNISKAVAYMEQNYAVPISNKALADMCSLSSDCFIRIFKKYYGTTPQKYLLALRLNEAKELLERYAIPINEICVKTGFESPAHFSKLFKEKVGVSPSEYRKQLG